MYELKFLDATLNTRYVLVSTLTAARVEVALCPSRKWSFIRLKVLSNGALFDARYIDYITEGSVDDESVR